MPASSLLTLIDDIATLLDDVALMTKTAAQKTAGVLGDDLALNAQQVAGVNADRELPVVWAVARGSFRNKLILVPAALAISALAPWAVTPLLMLGGLYLCFEGVEKLAHKVLHRADEESAPAREPMPAAADPAVDIVAYERDKIRGAIRTDFVLSAEIITITLGTVATAPFMQQVVVLSLIAVAMTVGVYGFVAGIVKIDDAGLWLVQRRRAWQRTLGRGLVALAPRLMRTLSVVGTLAMFMVGGGILSHGIAPLHHALADLAAHLATQAGALPGARAVLGALLPVTLDAIVGVVAGAAALTAVTLLQRLRGGRMTPAA